MQKPWNSRTWIYNHKGRILHPSPTPLKSICLLACVQHPLPPPPFRKIGASSFRMFSEGRRWVFTGNKFVFLLSLHPHISGCLKTLRFRKTTRPLEAHSNLFRPKRPNDGNTRVSLTGHALCKRMTSSVIENLRFRPSILTKTTLAGVFNSSFVVRSKVV